MTTNLDDQAVNHERKTIELCGDEMRHGIRCMRPKRHAGDHECYPPSGKTVRWK